ncbi:MAG: PP2C family protein-serine/threonine phosphatase [Prochlorococcaceae cyanobacterium]
MGTAGSSSSNEAAAWCGDMNLDWTSLQQRLWTERPLRQKLALGVWLSLVPIMLVASLSALQNARSVVRDRLRQQLIWDAEQASAWLTLWDQQHQRMLNVMAEFPAIANLQAGDAAEALGRLDELFPNTSYAITRRDGSTVNVIGGLLQPLEDGQAQPLMHDANSTTAKALKGIRSSAPLRPPYASAPCVASSVPVYGRADTSKSVVGAITSCLAMELLGEKTGINMLIKAASDNGTALPVLDLDAGKPNGYALLVVLKQGSTIVLGQEDNNEREEELLLNPEANQRSAWAPLIKLAQSSTAQTSYNEIQIKSTNYFVGVDRTHPGRSVLMVLDSRSAFSTVDDLFKLIWIGNLVALAVSSVAIYRICSALSKPIDRAGAALSRISRGEFGDPLPSDNSDVGRLFNYVNQASLQLEAYLEDAKQHAITDAQLEEARRIQADFLIKDLPNNQSVELAALFEPAYLIGADWYDAIALDGVTFVVVADVCDKGVPSALYMSVFRSLLRLSLSKEWALSEHTASETLCRAISTVNQYMADTHGSTGMFATAFVGAYDPGDGYLHYVVAGHEAPLVLKDKQQEELTIGGPAVGIFASARFEAHCCPFDPESILLAYSDGLPDARNPAGQPFGHAQIRSILAEQPSQTWSAQALIDRFEEAVRSHMQNADQFDDLTLLSLKVRN